MDRPVGMRMRLGEGGGAEGGPGGGGGMPGMQLGVGGGSLVMDMRPAV